MTEKKLEHPLLNKKAPAFALRTQTGETLKLSNFKDKWVVLYFYPRDNTPGCTVEANEFNTVYPELMKLGAVVLGVSPDSAESHCKFAEKYNLGFYLLADVTHEVAEKYGVWVEKNMCGKKSMGILRTTFLIDGNGKIRRVWSKVKPEGHAKEVVEEIRALAAS